MDKLRVTVKTKGIFKRVIIFGIEHGNITDYCYSLSDLILTLIKRFDINENELWLYLTQIENKYYKIKRFRL